MSLLSKAKMVLGDSKKTQQGKVYAIKKIDRKVAEKQTHAVGNTYAINTATEAKPEVKQTALHPPKKVVKKLITQSAVKSPSTKKNQPTKKPLIKIQKSQSKKSPGAKNPISTILNKVKTNRTKSAKRVLKAIPMIVTLPRDTTSHQADGTTKTNPAEKQLVKVERVLRKKLLSSLNGKTTKQDTVSPMAVENVIPISNTTKLLTVMTKQT